MGKVELLPTRDCEAGYGPDYRSHTGPLCAQCYFLPVTDMYILELEVFMHRFSIDDLPVVFKEYFTKLSDIHDYPSRHINDLNPKCNKKSVLIMLFKRVVLFFESHYQNIESIQNNY